MRPTTTFATVFGFALSFAATTGHTQEKVSFKCTFGPGTNANWDSGKVNIERTNFGKPSTAIQFDAIDVVAGTARMIGNAGSSDLVALNTGAGITLVETTPTGNLSFVTIFPAKRTGVVERTAVMSRHMNTPAGPFPSQYYGTCIPW